MTSIIGNTGTQALMAVVSIVCLAISGCAVVDAVATAGQPTDQERAQIEATRPICGGEKDCAAKWDAAQLWVVKNATMKIQTATNVVIETYNVIESESGVSASVTKEPVGDGRYKIVAHVHCSYCVARPATAVLDFNRTVAAAKP